MSDDPKPLRLGGYRLLIIDDSPDIGLLYRRVLQREGAVIDTTTSATAGLELAFKASYDLIVIDWEMPEMSGIECLTELRRRGYRDTVLALSAHSGEEKKTAASRAGFDGFMVKAGDWGGLADLLLPWLKSAQL